MFFVILFLLSQSTIPPEFADLAQRAIDNARNKTSKSSRQTSLNPGFHEDQNFHYKLLRPLTSSNTNDIKGFAKDDTHFAIAKRKNFNLKDDFVFVEPAAQKLYNLKTSVASDERVQIYEFQEVSLFEVLTDLEIHTSTWSKKEFNPTNGTSKTPQESVKQEFNYQWDTTANCPEMYKIAGSDMKYGYGAYASLDADITYSFSNPTDVKLLINVALGAYVGTKFEIPDDFEHEFSAVSLLDKTIPIPNLNFETSLLGFEIKLGAYLNLLTVLREMVLEIPVGFKYFKGYHFSGTKTVMITPTETVNKPWQFSFDDMLDETSSDSVLETITSASFSGVVDASLTLQLILKFGDVINAKVDIGLAVPFEYNLKFDKVNCAFPHLSLSLTIPIDFILKIDPVTLSAFGFQYTIFEGTDFSKTMKTFNHGPICLATQMNAFQILNKPGSTKYSVTLKSPNSKGFYTLISPTSGPFPNQFVLEVSYDSLFSNKYLFLQAVGLDVYLENHATLPNYVYGQLNTSPFKIVCITKPGSTKYSLTGFVAHVINNFQPLVMGTVATFTVTNQYYFAFLTSTVPFQRPNGTQGMVTVNGFYYSRPTYFDQNFMQRYSDNTGIVFSRFTAQNPIQICLTNTFFYLADGQHSITVDLNHFKLIRQNILSITKFNITVFCENRDQLKEIVLTHEKGESQTAMISEEPPYSAEFTIHYYKYDNLVFTFMPICRDESGIMCRQTYRSDAPGHQLFKYPNRKGISITGQGFLAEIIPVEAAKTIYYYKTFPEPITVGKFYYQTFDRKIEPKVEKVQTKLLAGEAHRVCLVDVRNSSDIFPFSRKYFNDHTDVVLRSMVQNSDTITPDMFTSDEDGCLLFDASSVEMKTIKDLPKEICDMPVDPQPQPEEKSNKMETIAGIAVAVLVIIAIIVGIVLCVRKRRKKNNNSDSHAQDAEL